MVRDRISKIRTDLHPTQMHAPIRRLLIVAAAGSLGQLAIAALPQIQTWISLPTGPSTQDPVSASTSPDTEVTTVTVPKGQTALAYFMPEGQQVQLSNPGDSLSIQFKLTFKSTPIGDSSTGFRLGLFDSNLSGPRPNGNSTTDFGGFDGYALNWNPNPATASNTTLNNLRLRLKLKTGTTGELLNEFALTNYSSTSTGVVRALPDPGRTYFLTDTEYTAGYTVIRQPNGALKFTINISEGVTFSFGNNFTVEFPTTYSLDTLAFYSVNTNGSDFNISGVTITAVPEPSTYAACAGAAVLGLALWRRRRTAAKAAVA